MATLVMLNNSKRMTNIITVVLSQELMKEANSISRLEDLGTLDRWMII